MSICEILALKLREIKEERGLSVVEFSEQLDISRSALQAILTCKGNPRTDTIEHIARKLGINPVYLLTLPSDPQPEHRLVEQITEGIVQKLKELVREDHERQD